MKSVEWNGEKWTTISAIANHYSEGDKALAKEIKPFIRTGTKKLKTIKLEKSDIEANYEKLRPIAKGAVTSSGLILINMKDVAGIERFFISVLKQKKENAYRKDRYHSRRSLTEEISFELQRQKIRITPDEYKAILSYASRREKGQPKINALQSASKKFKVTQVRINEILRILDIQIDYKNKPKDYV